jgi:2-polyprenyl-6-methoxyphenol hydroxylase-like FAD-dependent oxidoreductase
MNHNENERTLAMPPSVPDTDILIAGAGPVGLFLANECARRGIRAKLIEEQSHQSENSKALAIFPRTLEIFDMAGVIAPFLESANRVTQVSVISQGRNLAHMRFEPDESPYSFVAMVPQNITEKLLLAQLRRQGGDVEYRTRFVTAEQRADHVRVTVERNGTQSSVSAAVVVGCDGPHSAVRQALGLSLEGGEYHDLFMLADVETNDVLPANELQLCPSESGPLAIFPMSAAQRRIVATVDGMEDTNPSLALVRRIVAERGPIGFEAHTLNWSSYFRIHHRNAPALRSGRIFIAGDAAHIHSPFGGQGMNTGLHDVWNLIWKLDLFLRGNGSEALLASYETERLPIIRDVICTTDRLTKIMGTPNKFAQLLRETFIPMVSRLAPFQHAFVQRLSELGIDYHGSPIVEGPGTRYFEDSVRGGTAIRSRFLLLIDQEDEPSLAKARKMFTGFESVVEIRSSHQRGVVLVRPDGYIAYSATHPDSSSLDSVRLLLARQAGRTEPVHAHAS